MKRSTRKVIELAVIVVMLAALLSACTTPQPTTTIQTTPAATTQSTATTTDISGPDISEAVNLRMITMGSGSTDSPKVVEALNVMLKEDINATVEFEFVTNDSYALTVASGDTYDIIQTANWLDYAGNARKGAFYEITDEMLETYAPLSVSTTAVETLDCSKIDGKRFALANNKIMLNDSMYIVRGDLMAKYDISEIASIDDFERYLDAVAKNEKNMIPFDISSGDTWITGALYFGNSDLMAPGNPNCTSPLAFDKSDDSYNLLRVTEQPSYLEFVKKMKAWNEAGYWSKNALVNKVWQGDSFQNGKSATGWADGLASANWMVARANKDNPTWDVKAYRAFTYGFVDACSYMQSALSIGRNSPNPERALMLIDLLRADESYFLLSVYGIEEQHYSIDANDRITFVPNSTFPMYSLGGGWDNDKFIKIFSDAIPNSEEIIAEAKSRLITNRTADFAMDKSKVADAAANIWNAYMEYGMPLYMGFVDDVDAAVAEYQKKLQEAGLDAYQAELESQLAEYFKTH